MNRRPATQWRGELARARASLALHTVLCALFLLLNATGLTHAATDPRWAGEIVLVLTTAIPGNRALTVHLEHRDGQWTETWGEAFNYNTATHYVEVVESAFVGEELRLRVRVTYRPDFWIKPATGEYELTVQRQPAINPTVSDHTRLRSRLARASFTGVFSGSFTGHGQSPQPTSGAVEGVLLPWREPPPGFAVAQPGEHPRMLLRKTDVPALRNRANTPLGRAVVAELKELNHELAPAILFQLTGDTTYAQKAFAQVATGFKGEKGATHGYGGIETEHVADYPVGHQAATAFVYDLCYEAWTPGQRAATQEWLRWMAEWAIHKPWGYANTGSTASPIGHSAVVHAGGAILTCALWGIRSPPPPEPATGDDPLLKALGAAVSPQQLEQMRAAWRTQMTKWEASGGMDPALYEMFLLARRGVSCLLNEKIGEGGAIWGTGWPRTVMDSTIAYRNMFGADISARDELRNAAVLPLLMTVAWQPTDTYDRPLGPAGPLRINPADVVRLLVLAPPAWRPAIEEYWLRMVRMQRDDLATEEGARTFLRRSFPSRAPGSDEPWGLLYTLQYFGQPHSDKPAAPPRTWDVTARGQYLFRGGTAEEPILVTMDANLSAAMGPSLSGGHFEIFAFGQRWTASVPPTEGGDSRARHNVVHVPGQRFNGRARGKLLFQSADPATGNGGLTLELSEFCKEMVTQAVSIVETQRVGAMLVPKAITREVTHIADAGLRARRAMAVDFSGTCGAPALLVIADRFEGARDKLWLLNTPDLLAPARRPRNRPLQPPFAVATDANTFELRRDDVSVRGVFVAPAGIRPVFANHTVAAEHIHGTRSAGRGMLLLRRAGIEALVPAMDGDRTDFLVIITIQKGSAPEVKTTGAGLEARISVGGVPVRHDGEKIIIGK
jgi:hypothetical protein